MNPTQDHETTPVNCYTEKRVVRMETPTPIKDCKIEKVVMKMTVTDKDGNSNEILGNWSPRD